MKTLGIIFISLAILIFWLGFFVFAPFIADKIPLGEWQGFMQTMVYILVGWYCTSVNTYIIWYFYNPRREIRCNDI